jgi:hypothetical protein
LIFNIPICPFGKPAPASSPFKRRPETHLPFSNLPSSFGGELSASLRELLRA